MNKPVDVIATFNTSGEIKPLYVRVEENRALYTRKIEKIEYDREEKFAGTSSILYGCYISVGDQLKKIKIKYNTNTHQWLLVE
ncbi:MAG: hypothetical protein E7255_13345 [Lachnospiraceae bacterium]|nr:hypothetical protein [Lachnospiraceae bacterium]